MKKKEFEELKVGDKVALRELRGWLAGEVKEQLFDKKGKLIGVSILAEGYTFFSHKNDHSYLYHNDEENFWNEADIHSRESIVKKAEDILIRSFETWRETEMRNCLNVRFLTDLLKDGELTVTFGVQVEDKR